MTHKPSLHAVVSNDPRAAQPSGAGETQRPIIHDIEARLRNDAPDLIEQLRHRPPYQPTLLDDLHDFIAEVQHSPQSHALVAVLTIIAWTALLVAPLLLGLWS